MNLEKLFQMQKELDDRILAEHPIQEGEDRLAKKILALQVELGELANCWRGFKYWSYNQKPKTEELGECPLCKGTGDLGTVWAENCIECGGSGKVVVKNPLLEEYVDALHFLFSIGIEIGCDQNLTIGNVPKRDSLIDMFQDVFKQVAVFDSCINDLKYRFKDTPEYNVHRVHYSILLDLYLELGQMLGFTWEQIEKAYLEKNKINHERQESGY